MRSAGNSPKNTLIVMVLLIAGLGSASLFAGDDPIPIETSNALDNLISGLAPAQQQQIKADRPGFLDLLVIIFRSDSALTILVDKHHDLPASYEPNDLVNLESVKPKLTLNKGNTPLRLRKILMNDLQEMVSAARSEGVVLDISSAYRSYDYQKKLFARYVREDGLAEAERESAHAGSSQHQLGLAIDFGSVTPAFAATKAAHWLDKHARQFGFSLSYPEDQEAFTGYMFEPWHYRYVGRAAAAMEIRFFGGSQQTMLSFLHDQETALRQLLKI